MDTSESTKSDQDSLTRMMNDFVVESENEFKQVKIMVLAIIKFCLNMDLNR